MALVILLNGSKQIDATELFYWIPASFLMGAVTMILYTDKLHFWLLTAIHFVSCFGIVFAAVHLCGYMDTPFASLRAMMPEFIIIYVGIYLGVYAAFSFLSCFLAVLLSCSLNPLSCARP